MKFRIGLLCAALALVSGCVSPEEQRAQQLAADRQQCSQYGFIEATDPFASCMQTQALNRDRINQQKAALAQQQAQFEQMRKEKAAQQQAAAQNQGSTNIPPLDNQGNKAGTSTKDFPAGACTTVGNTTKCSSSTTTTGNCTTINGVTSCNSTTNVTIGTNDDNDAGNTN